MTGRLTRRSVLRLVAAAGGAVAARDFADGAQTPHLVADYRPSQPTGWPWTPGQSFATTIGGHTPSVDFTVNNRPCRVSVDPTVPRYEDRPTDFDVLARTSGAHYTFRYLGGFPGRGELRVQSYNAFAAQDGPGTRFGADLYVVYAPDLAHGDPPADDAMQWIQVVSRRDPVGSATEVDNLQRANPFYFYGGLTSVNGRLLVNFQDAPQTSVQIPSGALGEHLFRAETFLARDTGRRDRSGRGIVEVYGGFRWGWHAADLG